LARDDARKIFRAALVQGWHKPFGKCIGPWQCGKPPIRAHSVQRAGPLSLLAAQGRVIMFRQRFDFPRPPRIDFERIGVSKATIFTGLCAEHDVNLFRPLDQSIGMPASAESLFLLAYRAVLRETHVCNEVAYKLQRAYLKQIELGLADPNLLSEGGLFATHRLAIAYETWTYKESLEDVLFTEDFAAMKHDVLVLGTTGPCVAVSSLFSIARTNSVNDNTRIVVNVLPTPEGETFVVFSYMPADAESGREEIRALLSAKGAKQKYLVSRLLLEHCENIVIGLDHFSRFSEEKRGIIKDFFTATILANSAASFRDKRLDLFDTSD
jgi:hypothetical protein